MKISTRIIKLITAMVFFNLIISGFKNKEIDPNQRLYNSAVSINSQNDLTNSSSLLGSGVIISQDGLILTNYHVVYSSPSISVKFNDELPAERASIVKLDKERDLALIKVDRKFPIEWVAKFESLNNIYKGQQIVAIGTPLEEKFFNLISHGIISNKNVNSPMTYPNDSSITVLVKNCIMLDFAGNGGGSGGPVFNTRGNLVAIMSSSSHSQGISLAISLEEINNFLK